MTAAFSATFSARRVEARASPRSGPRAPETRERDVSRRVSSSSPHRRRGASRPALGEPERATLASSLPANFDLDTSILLAGFAFEAYNSPEGGMRDEDVHGGGTAYVGDFVRDVFAGVLEVRMLSARGLPKADALGASDPYVVLSVGGDDDESCRPKSSARTSTKRNTLNPRWGDDDARRLFVRRDPNARTLALDVFDEDRLPGKDDDFLGTATVSFADLVGPTTDARDASSESSSESSSETKKTAPSSAARSIASALASKAPGFRRLRRRDVRGARLEGGPGGGEVDLCLTFTPFAPPAREVASAGLKRAAALLSAAERTVADASPAAGTSGRRRRAARREATLAARAASVVAREAAKRLDAMELEATRAKNESSLWAVEKGNDWSVLASESRRPSRAAGLLDATPERYSKACFVEHARTDTQCAVWQSRRDRTIVVAFRGTEMDKPLDFFTDVNFKPAPFEFLAERGAPADARGAGCAHAGFLRAYESVRARVFAAVDDVIEAEKLARARDDDDDDARDDSISGPDRGNSAAWHVFVTGHSLGGALATLFACELGRSARGPAAARRRDVTVTMYNFGSPRVGDGAFCDAYNAFVPDSVRVVNRADLVPTLPALLGYRHVDHGVRVSAGIGGGAAEIAAAGDARRISPDANIADDARSNRVAASEGEGEDASFADASDRRFAAREKETGESPLTAGKIVRLAERLGVVGTLGVDAETAADAAEALASLASLDALADHFEDEYLVALRAARKAE